MSLHSPSKARANRWLVFRFSDVVVSGFLFRLLGGNLSLLLVAKLPQRLDHQRLQSADRHALVTVRPGLDPVREHLLILIRSSQKRPGQRPDSYQPRATPWVHRHRIGPRALKARLIVPQPGLALI